MHFLLRIFSTYDPSYVEEHLYFSDEFHQIIKEETLLIITKLFQKTEKEAIFCSSFCEARNILIAKHTKSIMRKLQNKISNKYRCKNS